MVDVSEKPATARRAVAEAEIVLEQDTLSLIIDGGAEKGDVLGVAELAGIMGGKKTAELIPLCHPIPLTDLAVEIRPDRGASALRIRASAATLAPTGVEMEALTAATVAALTVYDMVKSIDRSAEIRHVRLLEKSGGRSGEWQRPEEDRAAREAPRDGRRSFRGPRRSR
jgi:cyclic pyranopterin phosphate synthase